MSEASVQPRPWRRRMTGRNPDEPHRTPTPLELLFDLTFVVAVSIAANQLYQGLTVGQVGSALVSYGIVFFGVWWAWMNFTWFASAYDTDDVPYRLLTLVQIGGVLVFAAGIPVWFDYNNLTTALIGYVIMRVAMVAQWLRAAYADPERRSTSTRYAAGIAAVQVGWVALLWVPGHWLVVGYVLLVLAELAVPVWAESFGPTPWHLGHITKRYGRFVNIIFGGVIAAIAIAVQAALASGSLSLALLAVAVGGLLLVFAIWWFYFQQSVSEEIRQSLRSIFIWAYGYFIVFAALAAIGAGLQIVIYVLEGVARVTPMFAAFTLAIPVAIFLVAAGLIRSKMSRQLVAIRLVLVIALLVLLVAWAVPFITLPVSTLFMALLVALLLAYQLVAAHRAAEQSD